MRIPYKNDLPVAVIKVIGKTTREIEAHIDFAASRTIVPTYVADQLELKLAGYVSAATGAGIILLPEYEADVEAFNRTRRMVLGCLDLPEESPIKALIGRNILDEYKVCLDGKNKEVEIFDP